MDEDDDDLYDPADTVPAVQHQNAAQSNLQRQGSDDVEEEEVEVEDDDVRRSNSVSIVAFAYRH